MGRPIEELAPKLWRIPVPLPPMSGAEHLGFTNAYLLGGSDAWMLVDTGMTTDEAVRIVERGLEQAGIGWGDLDLIAITHHHPDHYGGSGRLRDLTGAQVLMHRDDFEMVFEGIFKYPSVGELVSMHGGPELDVSPLAFMKHPAFKPAAPDRYLADDQHLDLGGRAVRVLHTPGHTPGHCCFEVLEEQIVLTGDHVLPKITPHVGYYPGSDDPLADFLDSLKRIGEGGYRQALPAHGEPFLDPASRCARIVRHHEFRLRACVDALGRKTLTGWEVVPAVFGEDLEGFHRFAAMFEALAHLVLAESRGEVQRVTDDAGVIRWRRIA